MKNREHINNATILVSDGYLKYVQMDCFERYAGDLTHCMSTRLGGVSAGECDSLNFGFNSNDSGYIQYNGTCKWKIDLQGIISFELIKSGLLHEKICASNICTKCNKNLFFSHRGDGGKTGSLAAFMQLR